MAVSARTLQCVVVTPERAVLDEPVDFVALPMCDGELGVLPGRAALIGRLGYGELRIRNGATTRRYYVDGGFAQVRSDVVTVLTPKALLGEDIDSQKAAEDLAASLESAPRSETPEGHFKKQERSRAQLRVARRARGEL